nr:unnamed protein product [Callosobruchus analis]
MGKWMCQARLPRCLYEGDAIC